MEKGKAFYAKGRLSFKEPSYKKSPQTFVLKVWDDLCDNFPMAICVSSAKKRKHSKLKAIRKSILIHQLHWEFWGFSNYCSPSKPDRLIPSSGIASLEVSSTN